MINKKSKIVEYQDYNGNLVKLSTGLIRKYLVKGSFGISDQEAMMFLMLCKNRGLNPFTGEAHLIKHSPHSPATMVVGKDAFTARAAGHSDYNGMRAGIVVERDGEVIYREGAMRLEDEGIVGGWAEVFRKSWEHPVKAEVSYEEYEGRTRDGRPNSTWAKMGATMIRKVALVQALREAFPDQFGGLYDSAEMSQATDVIDLTTEVEKPTPTPPDVFKGSGEDDFDEVDVVGDAEMALPPREFGAKVSAKVGDKVGA